MYPWIHVRLTGYLKLRVITDSRLEMTRITETVEESQLRIISTVESRCDGIVGEIRNLKEDYTTQICAIPERNGYYKGVSCCGIIRTCGYMTR